MQVAILSYDPKNPRSSERGFFICVRRTQHHFERSENIISHEAAQMNDVAASRK